MHHFASSAAFPVELLQRTDDYLGRWGIVLLVVLLFLALLGNAFTKAPYAA